MSHLDIRGGPYQVHIRMTSGLCFQIEGTRVAGQAVGDLRSVATSLGFDHGKERGLDSVLGNFG